MSLTPSLPPSLPTDSSSQGLRNGSRISMPGGKSPSGQHDTGASSVAPLRDICISKETDSTLIPPASPAYNPLLASLSSLPRTEARVGYKNHLLLCFLPFQQNPAPNQPRYLPKA